MSNTDILTIRPVEGNPQRMPLRVRFPRELHDQAAYITLDVETATIAAGYNPLTGNAEPAEVYVGRLRRFRISNRLRTFEINALVREAAPLAERVLAGASFTGERWTLNDDALDAQGDIDAIAARTLDN